MSEQSQGEGEGLSQPLADAPLVGEAPATKPPRPGWRSPARIAAVGTALVVVVAAAIVIPMKLTSARTVSGALGGVFSSSTVGFSLSTNSPSMAPYSLDLVLANPSGGPVSEAAHLYSDVAVVEGGSVLAELRTTNAGLFVRLDPTELAHSSAFGMAGERFLKRLHKLASKHKRLEFLNQLAEGKWLGIKAGALRRADKRLLGSLGVHLPKAHARHLEGAVGSSFGQAWDEWASLHEVSSQDGTTEYSVDLPVKSFATSLVHSLVKDVRKSLPEMASLLGGADRSVASIPATERLPIDLWIAGGELTKVSVSQHGKSLTAAIDHPAAPTTPSGVTYIHLKGLLQGLLKPIRSINSGGFVRSSVSSQIGPPMGLAMGDLAVVESFKATHSFSALFEASSPHSLAAITKKFNLPAGSLSWRDDAPSAGRNQVSVSVVGGGAAVVLVSAEPAQHSCVGLLYVGARTSTPILGAKRHGGSTTYFTKKLVGGACNAAGVREVPANSSTSGWQGYAPLSQG